MRAIGFHFILIAISVHVLDQLISRYIQRRTYKPVGISAYNNLSQTLIYFKTEESMVLVCKGNIEHYTDQRYNVRNILQVLHRWDW